MKTRRLRGEREEDIAEAAALLRGGGLVAFATETVYGLGANALDGAAVGRIFEAKERPAWDPLIVHVAGVAEVGRVAEVGELRERVDRMAGAFWPGPLTMLLPRAAGVPDAVTAGRERVGVRVPGHAGARRLIELAGVPVAAPSANLFGHTSPTTAEHVLEDLDGRIDAVLDGGATSVGVESTVVDVCEWPMRIYRPGAVTAEALREVSGEEVSVWQAGAGEARERGGLPSPGVGLRHYAPRARLVLVADEEGMRMAVRGREGAGGGDVARRVGCGGWSGGVSVGAVGGWRGDGAAGVCGAAGVGWTRGGGDCVSGAGGRGDGGWRCGIGWGRRRSGLICCSGCESDFPSAVVVALSRDNTGVSPLRCPLRASFGRDDAAWVGGGDGVRASFGRDDAALVGGRGVRGPASVEMTPRWWGVETVCGPASVEMTPRWLVVEGCAGQLRSR